MHRRRALMQACPHFPLADNVNEGWCWIIKDKFSCKQRLENQTEKCVLNAIIYSWSGIKREQTQSK